MTTANQAGGLLMYRLLKPGLSLPWWLIVLGLLAGMARAEPLVLEGAILDGGNLSAHLQLLEDPQGSLTLEQVQGMTFQPNMANSANFGFSSSAWWVRLTLDNPYDRHQEVLLRQDYPLIDWLEFWAPDAQGAWQVRRTGDRTPFASREVQHRDFIFVVDLPAHSQRTYYLRYASGGPVNIALSLYSPQALIERISLEQLAYGCYYGGFLALVLYNLFMFLAVRDRAFLFYLLYVSCYGLYMAVHNGLTYQFLWPHNPALANDSLLLLLGLSLFGGLKFTRTILATRRLAPRLDLLGRALQALCLLLLLAIPLFSYAQLIQPYSYLTLVVTLQLLLLGIAAFVAGSRPARYYLLAWTALLVGVTVYMLKTFGWLPHNWMTQNAFQLGSLIEMLLLSLALGARVRDLHHDSYRDALTGLANRRQFDERMREHCQQYREHGQPLSLLLLDIDHFKRFNDEFGHQAGDRVLQEVARLLQLEVRRPYTACRYGGEEFAVIMPDARGEAAEVLAERLRRELRRASRSDAPLTLSIGIASLDEGRFDSPEQLFAAADSALYAAKSGGRDRVMHWQAAD
ncbi:diguanylate cyclase [Pseudomonas sp. BMS12]|uniref:diguanylate cyclase n=1 Tax=Pseudomonas sp. BMS12 TaxID=1796033 RepID=UPI0009ED6DFC|nr:diguanylate cyclase [Pseudomonas sp. BMS12]